MMGVLIRDRRETQTQRISYRKTEPKTGAMWP